ncbi:MAG: ATP synthase F1 subunit gamma [Treponema sp.]|jgi:F-type H+-transporting ATPase subunit gamma|nr:ATP synthase F1 subunit gamma [Treponema sp.]
MASGQDVRLRMRAIRQTLQVTKAMNLISTAKLRKGRRVLEDTKSFFTRIQKSLYDIIAGAEWVHSEFFENSADSEHKTAIVIISTDKGLAGGYNANIFRYLNTVCEQVQNPLLIPVGNIGYRHLSHSPYHIIENFSFHAQLPTFDDAKMISDYLISQYLWGVFNEIHIVYTHMYSTIKLIPSERQIFPLDAKKIQQALVESGLQKREILRFEYLPSVEAVFNTLIPFYVRGLVYGCLIEAYTSEQSARMAAMDEASKNAEEMLSNLQITYNRARQASITQEMAEIVGGTSF